MVLCQRSIAIQRGGEYEGLAGGVGVTYIGNELVL